MPAPQVIARHRSGWSSWSAVLLAALLVAGAFAETGGDETAQNPPESAAADEPTTGPASAAAAPDDDTSADAEEREASAKPRTLWDFLQTTARLTGDWGGARPALEQRGVTLDLTFTTLYQQVYRGGPRTHDTGMVTGSYDLELTLDFGALKLLPGGKLYTYAEGGWGDGLSPFIGDLLGVNYDARGDLPIAIYELWYEQALLDDRLKARFGMVDLTAVFATNAFANDQTTQFLNSALYFPSNIPTQQPAQSLLLIATPADWLYFQAAIADGDAQFAQTGFNTAYHGPADFTTLYEFGLTPNFATGWGKLPGNYRFGLWYDPQPKPIFYNDHGGRIRTPSYRYNDLGFYVSFDQVLFRENPQDPEDEQGLGWFCRYSYARGDVNLIEDFWSVGAQYQGLVPTRDQDVLAVGAAQGVLSEDYFDPQLNPHRETAIELYYRIQVCPWLHVSPDFQWILCPNGLDGRDAFVAGLRLSMSF